MHLAGDGLGGYCREDRGRDDVVRFLGCVQGHGGGGRGLCRFLCMARRACDIPVIF